MLRLIDFINEATYKDILGKQGDITKLFPTFKQRVRTVGDKGGVRLVSTKPGVWKFRVKSASIDDHWYDDYIRWVNIEATIAQAVAKKEIWKKDESGVDLRKLAVEVMFNTDIQVTCSCPADLYWGGQYIRTRRNAKYTEPENRPPVVRNPNQYGAMCKHAQLVFDTLPFYGPTMASYLRTNYAKDIQAAEDAVKRGETPKVVGKAIARPAGEKPQARPSKEPPKAKKDTSKPSKKPKVPAKQPKTKEAPPEEPKGATRKATKPATKDALSSAETPATKDAKTNAKKPATKPAKKKAEPDTKESRHISIFTSVMEEVGCV